MDLISRQAAIDRINKQREHLRPDIYPQDKIGDAAYRICAEFIERLPSVQPEQDREFLKLTVRNSNGRPYYSIIYLEVDDNGVGHDFEGYSSYSLDVISDYLKKYFMPPVQPEIIRCKDCKHWTRTCGDDRWGVGDCDVFDKHLVMSEGYCAWAERRTDG